MTSHTAIVQEYDRRAEADPRLLRCVREVDETDPAAHYAATAIGRPVFARNDEILRLTADIRATIHIMDDLPARCFGGSVEDYLAAQAYHPQEIAAIMAGRVGAPVDYGRADVLRGPDGYRVLEINTGSAVGGQLTTTLNSALLKNPAFAAFAAEFGLTWVSPLQVLVADLRRLGRTQVGTDAPVVAVVSESGSSSDDPSDRQAAELRSRGMSAIRGEFHEIDFVDGKARLRGQPIDILLRFFFPKNVPMEQDGVATMRALGDAHRAGKTALLAAMDTDLHDSKAAIGLLFDPSIRAKLSDDEIAVIDRLLPWTRLVGPAFPLVTPASRAALVEECLARQADLVLKPANLHASQGIVLGDEVSRDEWRQTLESSPQRDLVAQERIRPVAETVVDPDTAEPRDWKLLWQVFFGPAGFGGVSVRGCHQSAPGAIGGNDHTTSGCVFLY